MRTAVPDNVSQHDLGGYDVRGNDASDDSCDNTRRP